MERVSSGSVVGHGQVLPQASVEPGQAPHFSDWVVLIRSHNPKATFKYKCFIL